MKQTWKILKIAMNSQLPDHFMSGNDKISNKKEISKMFNTFVSTIGSNVSNSVITTPTNFWSNPHRPSMFFDPITPYDTINIVSKLKTKSRT